MLFGRLLLVHFRWVGLEGGRGGGEHAAGKRRLRSVPLRRQQAGLGWPQAAAGAPAQGARRRRQAARANGRKSTPAQPPPAIVCRRRPWRVLGWLPSSQSRSWRRSRLPCCRVMCRTSHASLGRLAPPTVLADNNTAGLVSLLTSSLRPIPPRSQDSLSARRRRVALLEAARLVCACCVSPRAARHVQEEAGAFRARVAGLPDAARLRRRLMGTLWAAGVAPLAAAICAWRCCGQAATRPNPPSGAWVWSSRAQPCGMRPGLSCPGLTFSTSFFGKKKKSVVQRGREDGREVPAEAGQSVAAAHAPQDEEDEVGWTGAVTTQLLLPPSRLTIPNPASEPRRACPPNGNSAGGCIHGGPLCCCCCCC